LYLASVARRCLQGQKVHLLDPQYQEVEVVEMVSGLALELNSRSGLEQHYAEPHGCHESHWDGAPNLASLRQRHPSLKTVVHQKAAHQRLDVSDVEGKEVGVSNVWYEQHYRWDDDRHTGSFDRNAHIR